jgi:hypothetical protein
LGNWVTCQTFRCITGLICFIRLFSFFLIHIFRVLAILWLLNFSFAPNIYCIDCFKTVIRVPVSFVFPAPCINQVKLTNPCLLSWIELKDLSSRSTKSTICCRFYNYTIVSKNSVYGWVVNDPSITCTWVWCKLKVDSLVCSYTNSSTCIADWICIITLYYSF